MKALRIEAREFVGGTVKTPWRSRGAQIPSQSARASP